MKVGFIGVGNMGGPMCRNIIRNTNHDVVVFDLNPAAIKACIDLVPARAHRSSRSRRIAT
jgi:3-hydroxyisobutyrate dehydrogenase-like beta-hydroxyacid dehydrogenase